MRFLKSFALAAAIAVPALATVPAFAASDEGVVKFRMNNMKVIGGAMQNIVGQLKGEAPVQDQIAAYATILAEGAKLSTAAFKDNVLGTEAHSTAKAEIWSDWAKFEAGLKAMETTSAKLAEVAATGDMAAVGAQLQEVGKTCKGCHDSFRNKDKH